MPLQVAEPAVPEIATLANLGAGAPMGAESNREADRLRPSARLTCVDILDGVRQRLARKGHLWD